MTTSSEPGQDEILFSVVVPAYNASDTLAKCLEALVSQKGYVPNRNIEIIVVDDGSTDETASIADKFAVRLIKLPNNEGRIVARKTGIEAARSENILLVDTRVIVSNNLFDSIDAIGYTPLMTGNLGLRVEEKGFELLFYMIKRWYYRPYYPQTEYAKELWIDQDNFYQVPKGTGCILIDRQLFLDALPEDQGKGVNDDTRLFEYVVMERAIRILRHTEMAVRYIPREESVDVSRWLFGRGLLFSDFMLFKNPRYIGLLLFSIVFLIAELVVLVMKPVVGLVALFALFIGYVGAAAYISQTVRKFRCALQGLYKVIVIFWAGSLVGLFLKMRARGVGQ